MCGMKSYHTSTPKQDKEGGQIATPSRVYRSYRSVIRKGSSFKQLAPIAEYGGNDTP